jgi:type IV secretion system protein TrbL
MIPQFPTLNLATLQLQAFLGQLQTGYHTILPALWRVGILLLTLDLVLMALGWALGAGEHLLAMFVRWILWTGFVILILQVWPDWTTTFLASLVQLGLTLGGNSLTPAQFFDPSAVLFQGFHVAWGLMKEAGQQTGWTAMFGVFNMAMLVFSFLVIVTAYFVLAVHIFLAVLEFYLLVSAAAIFLPFAFFRHTWFLAEIPIRAALALAIRLLVLAVVTSLIWPVLRSLALPEHASYLQALAAGAMAWVFALLAWHAPAMAATLAQSVAVLTAQNTVRTVHTAAVMASSTVAGPARAARAAVAVHRTMRPPLTGATP